MVNKNKMIDIEKQILQLYQSGEREFSRFINMIGSKEDFIGSGTSRTEILKGVIKKHNLKMVKVNRGPDRYAKERVFMDLYMGGARNIEDYMWHPDFVKWSYEVFVRQIDRFDYRDLIFPTKQEFEAMRKEEYKRIVWCRWLFDEKDDKIYDIEDIDQAFYNRFGPNGGGSFSLRALEIREWIDNYVKYFGLEGQSEKKIKLAFKRLNNCWGEQYSKDSSIFKSYLHRVVKEGNIKDFLFEEDEKQEDEVKNTDKNEQEPDFFYHTEEFEGGDE